jgi:hypothetical protein
MKSGALVFPCFDGNHGTFHAIADVADLPGPNLSRDYEDGTD